MTIAEDLWAEVLATNEGENLKALTNPRDGAALEVDTVYGVATAQSVIDLFPLYTSTEYDATSRQHVEVANQGVIALLRRRNGTTPKVDQQRWEEVFIGPQSMMARVRRIEPRAHGKPQTNSGVQQAPETSGGRRVAGWSDRASLPPGIMPNRTTAR